MPECGLHPLKALLDSSHRYAEAAGHLSDHGIGVSDVTLDIASMMARKEKIVSQLTGGVSGLLKANGITVITGAATLNAGRQVAVASADGSSQTYTADHVVLAAGSEPAAIPLLQLTETGSSTHRCPVLRGRPAALGSDWSGCDRTGAR